MSGGLRATCSDSATLCISTTFAIQLPDNPGTRRSISSLITASLVCQSPQCNRYHSSRTFCQESQVLSPSLYLVVRQYPGLLHPLKEPTCVSPCRQSAD